LPCFAVVQPPEKPKDEPEILMILAAVLRQRRWAAGLKVRLES
jgi:hypothetical protein